MPKREILGDIWGAWGAIEDLRKRLYLVAAGLASATFAASNEEDLLDLADVLLCAQCQGYT
jgi:hypothetical protein